MSVEILPDGRTRSGVGAVRIPEFGGAFGVKVHCTSCGKGGGWVPQENTTRAFYVCDDCLPTVMHLLGPNQAVAPDQVFWQMVIDAQTEKYGRPLTSEEMDLKLKDPESLESKLARDRKVLTPK